MPHKAKYNGHEWADLPTTKDVKVAKVIKILANELLTENRKSKSKSKTIKYYNYETVQFNFRIYYFIRSIFMP